MSSVYVNGQNVAALGFLRDLEWRHQWPGGCWSASFEMGALARTATSRYLRRGSEVRIYEGAWPVWRGVLDELGESNETFGARGYVREAERFMAVDDIDAFSVDTVDVITQAIADGWLVDFDGTAPTGLPSDQPQYVHQLIDRATTAAGIRWGVDAHGRLMFAADPTTPTLLIAPGLGLMGRADDTYATHLYADFVEALSGTPPVPSLIGSARASDPKAAALNGRAAFYVDLKPRGLLTQGQADSILSGMLTKGRARIGYSNGFTVGAHHILTRGGRPACLATMTPGRMARVFGTIAPDGTTVPGGSEDVVLSATAYRAGAPEISLNPVGLAARDLGSILSVTAPAQSAA